MPERKALEKGIVELLFVFQQTSVKFEIGFHIKNLMMFHMTLTSMLHYLKCPSCEGELTPLANAIKCGVCHKQYPVLAGVLVLVDDVRAYLTEHAKGIARYVEESEIPTEYLSDFLEARGEIESEHIEEDLEAERVTALYLMTHYLHARDIKSQDPLLNGLIKKHWDTGPFYTIKKMLTKRPGKQTLVELGCGVGGLYAALEKNLELYLGLDSSFASIALARHCALGAQIAKKSLRVPYDLLQGPVSREIKIRPPRAAKKPKAEFVVCDLSAPPLKPGMWTMTAALNVIDMLPEPAALPALQRELLVDGGTAIQSCPYIWHPEVAANLRTSLPKGIRDSAKAVEHLYEKAGFRIDASKLHVPWLFFKNARQLEIYSVHLFLTSKGRAQR